MTLVALDDFAGTGWGVACLKMGIREGGVEKMPEAIATRAANGMVTIGTDVWAHIKQQLAAQGTPDYFGYSLYIGSPPCQTFSLAGNGSGRRALDEVIGLIDSRAYLDVDLLHEFGERHDPRTALVLAPLVRIVNDVPTYVVLEQVPPVLPVWERYAVELRRWGYSVWVGILNAEQYGVPQTRKRAVLIARADGIEAAPPKPTHSRYYPTNPAKLDEGVLPWVSMAQALRWGMTVRPSMTVTGGGGHGSAEHPRGGAEPFARGSRQGMQRELEAGNWVPQEDARYFHPMTYGRRAIFPGDEPAPTIRGVQRGMPDSYEPHPGDAVMLSQYSTGHGEKAGEPGERRGDQPAATVTGKAYSNRHTFVSNDKQPHSARLPIDAPAPTLTAGHDSGNRKWLRQSAHSQQNGPRDRPTAVPMQTVASDVAGFHYIDDDQVDQRSLDLYRDVWQHGESGEPIRLDPAKPATTVAADPRLTAREHHNHGEQSATSTRVTVAEAAALQSYPADFDWSPMVPVLRNGVDTGKLAPLSKTKAFLQIGNAVPPTLAEAILSVFPR